MASASSLSCYHAAYREVTHMHARTHARTQTHTRPKQLSKVWVLLKAWSFFDTWGPCSQCAGGLRLLASPWHIGRGFTLLVVLGCHGCCTASGVIIGKLDPQVRSCSLCYKCAVVLRLQHYSAPCWWGPNRPKQLSKVRVLLKPGPFLTHIHTHNQQTKAGTVHESIFTCVLTHN